MGIFIYEAVSKSVTEDEWKKVYEETLTLVEAFPLAERGRITYAGKEVICAVPSREQITTDYRGREKAGWSASMDYDTLKRAEEYYLPRDLLCGREPSPEAGDAIMGVLPAYLNYDWKDERCSHTYSLWDAKTQGEPYHMYLLAIGCLIEERLGEKAFVYGDITFGQCRKAVEMANQYLDQPIRVPARCEMGRWYERIRRLPLEESEKVTIFEKLYLGLEDENFYSFMSANFGVDALWEYWKRVFKASRIGTRGFAGNLKRYLSSGLGLEELCQIVCLEKDGERQDEEFIRMVMDSKLHLREKNTRDCLDIHPESEQPYSIWSLFAGFTFGAAHNVKVDRYLPIEEIRRALKKGLGKDCDVDGCIDRYLEEEAAAPEIDLSKGNLSQEELERMVKADASEVFQQMMDKEADKLQNVSDQYDISSYEDLDRYKKGSTVAPGVMEALGKSFRVYHDAVKEQRYKELMKGSHVERCAYLIEQNRYLMLRDRDWMQIFSEIENNVEAYERYYPMVRVKIDRGGLDQMVRALVLNRELYAFAEELSLR